ncbi:LysR family transcriptional regulator [Ideonella azotifigens]|nr:LysR family transcriptional regulator [Ideonella azotifigens]MCD2343092.1 LysR family transcriptional regulator [Ideonella azotifigens]
MDRVHLMSVFVAVVDTHSLAGAARKLALSPPAVTRAVTELETLLGVRLLTRTTRVVRVTDAGARYAEDCRRILADLAEADESVSGMHATPRGKLMLTAPVMFGALYVTPIVTEYLQRYPEVNAECWFLDRVVNIVDEGIDLAVRIGNLADSSLQAIQVGQVRRVICAAPGYLEQHGTPATPDELARHCIVASTAASTSEWRLHDNGESRLVKVQPRMTTTTNESALAAAVGGFGLTRLMSYQAAAAVAEGRLKIVLSAFEGPPLPIHLVHREGRHASQKARAFLDLAMDRLRAHPLLQPG